MRTKQPNSEKRILKERDICVLIKSCAEAGVSVLKFGDLYVRFGTKTDSLVDKNTPFSTFSSDAALSDAQLQEISQGALEQDEFKLREAQLSEMMITDPFEFERQVASGDLVDEETQPTGTDSTL